MWVVLSIFHDKYISTYRSSEADNDCVQSCSAKKSLLKNSKKFSGKYPCLFLRKLLAVSSIKISMEILYFFETVIKAALHRCSYEKIFWKYTANLQANTHAKLWFQKSCKATCCIFSEHLFIRIPLEGCFLIKYLKFAALDPRILES